MGLIKAVLNSATSVIADTWKDYFVCDSLQDNVLMVKGVKKGSGLFDKNDVITNGSGIVVADGQCALIVDDGIVVEVANEPGSYTFDTTKSPSIFDGGLQGLKDTFKLMIERFTYEGVTNRSQSVYYVNTKELPGFMYGTASPIPFKVSDPSINLNNMEVQLKCNGEYSIKITNPILFYKNVAGNADTYYKDSLESIMKSEFLTALQPAIAKLSQNGVAMYSDIPLHTFELADSLNEVLSNKWSNNRGISIVTVGINAITPRDEDLAKIQNLQEAASLRDPSAAASALAAAQAQAMRDAAKNEAGAAMGFMNVNMAQGASQTISTLFEQGQSQAKAFCPYCGAQIPQDASFCPKCGKAVK